MARDSFLLRTDPQTMAALRKWADDELRSVNGQIEFVLRRALREAGRLSEVGGARPATPGDRAETSAVPGRATDTAAANGGIDAGSEAGGG